MDSLINIGIILTYIMVLSGALAALVFGVMRMMKKSNSTKKTLYAIIGLVVVFLVAYFIASDEVLNSYEKYNITASTSKQVGMGLNTFYLLAASAVIAVIYSEFSKAFGK